MNCKKISILMSACIDGEITAAENTHLKSHLSGCAVCREKFERLKKTDALLIMNKPAGATPFFETRFYEKVAGIEAVPASILDLIGVEKKLLCAFAVLMLIVSGISLINNGSVNNISGTNHGYTELQSYVAGTSDDSASTGLLSKQEIEIDDIVSYIVNGEV